MRAVLLAHAENRIGEPTTASCLLGARGGHLAAHAGRWTKIMKKLLHVCVAFLFCGVIVWTAGQDLVVIECKLTGRDSEISHPKADCRLGKELQMQMLEVNAYEGWSNIFDSIFSVTPYRTNGLFMLSGSILMTQCVASATSTNKLETWTGDLTHKWSFAILVTNTTNWYRVPCELDGKTLWFRISKEDDNILSNKACSGYRATRSA